MTPAEIAWLDAYHADVRTKLAHGLDDDERDWLIAATAPLAAAAPALAA